MLSWKERKNKEQKGLGQPSYGIDSRIAIRVTFAIAIAETGRAGFISHSRQGNREAIGETGVSGVSGVLHHVKPSEILNIIPQSQPSSPAKQPSP